MHSCALADATLAINISLVLRRPETGGQVRYSIPAKKITTQVEQTDATFPVRETYLFTVNAAGCGIYGKCVVFANFVKSFKCRRGGPLSRKGEKREKKGRSSAKKTNGKKRREEKERKGEGRKGKTMEEHEKKQRKGKDKERKKTEGRKGHSGK